MSTERWEWLEQIERVGPEGLMGWASFPPDRFASGDHFPGTPLVPGVLLLEAMAQAAGWWVAWGESWTGKAVLARVDEAVFRRPVIPGEPVQVFAKGLAADGARRSARCRVEGANGTLASAWIGLRFFRFDEPGGPWRPPLGPAWMKARWEALRVG
ncbi:MAG: hypothetical protein OHK005_09810 [Candidatus Methylacidiphilales bacterium]